MSNNMSNNITNINKEYILPKWFIMDKLIWDYFYMKENNDPDINNRLFLFDVYYHSFYKKNKIFNWSNIYGTELLKLRICDGNWRFHNIDVDYDINSKELLFSPSTKFHDNFLKICSRLLHDLHNYNSYYCPKCIVHNIDRGTNCYNDNNELVKYILKDCFSIGGIDLYNKWKPILKSLDEDKLLTIFDYSDDEIKGT